MNTLTTKAQLRKGGGCYQFDDQSTTEARGDVSTLMAKAQLRTGGGDVITLTIKAQLRKGGGGMMTL